MQVFQRRAEDLLGIAPDLDHAAVVWLADHMAVLGQLMRAQHLHHRVPLLGANLQQHAELFVEQRLQRQLFAPGADLTGPVLRVAEIGATVLDAVALGNQHVDIQAKADMPGKSHLAGRRPEAAVTAIVISQQLAGGAQLIHRQHQALQLPGIVKIGQFMAELIQGLRQDAAAHSRASLAQIDQDQAGVASLQLRRQAAARIGQRCEGGDDQGHRRSNLQLGPIGPGPAGTHRQRILADRDRDTQRRAEFHAHRLDRVKQRGVLARFAASSHPVGRQLDA